jgi:hypothetical protein
VTVAIWGAYAHRWFEMPWKKTTGGPSPIRVVVDPKIAGPQDGHEQNVSRPTEMRSHYPRRPVAGAGRP